MTITINTRVNLMNNINKALTIMCLFMFSIRPAISEDGINMKKLMTKYRLPKEAVDKDNLRPIYKKLMQEKIRGTYDNMEFRNQLLSFL
jgi:hypothetical protein